MSSIVSQGRSLQIATFPHTSQMTVWARIKWVRGGPVRRCSVIGEFQPQQTVGIRLSFPVANCELCCNLT